jgi:hypothetical protein
MANIVVYNKNAKVVILLATGVSYVDENDGSFLAEADTGTSVKIKDVAKNRHICLEVPFANIVDNAGAAIGTDQATTVSTLNERFFDVSDSILFKSQVRSAVGHSKGDLLTIFGSYKQGLVTTKQASNNAVAALAFGMATEATSAGAIGEAISVGHFSGVDTSSMSVGDAIYLDGGITQGDFTNVRPANTGDIIQALGYVTKSDATDGEVFLNITPDHQVVPAPTVKNFISGAFFDNTIRDVYLPVNATDNENAFLQRWNRWVCPYDCKIVGFRFRRDYTTATSGTVTFGVYSNNTGSVVTLVDETTVTPLYGSGTQTYIAVDADVSAGITYAFRLENDLNVAMGNCVFSIIIEQ